MICYRLLRKRLREPFLKSFLSTQTIYLELLVAAALFSLPILCTLTHGTSSLWVIQFQLFFVRNSSQQIARLKSNCLLNHLMQIPTLEIQFLPTRLRPGIVKSNILHSHDVLRPCGSFR